MPPLHADALIVRNVRRYGKRTAVQEIETVALPALFPAALRQHRQERVHLVRRISAGGLDAQRSLRERGYNGRSFPRPRTRKPQRRISAAGIRQFRAEGKSFRNLRRLLPRVAYHRAAHEDVRLLRYGIIEVELDVRKVVFECQDQRFVRLPRARHPLQMQRALYDFMRNIAEPAHRSAVFPPHDDGCGTEIPAPETAALGGHAVRRYLLIIVVRVWRSGQSVRRDEKRRIRRADLFAPIQVLQ